MPEGADKILGRDAVDGLQAGLIGKGGADEGDELGLEVPSFRSRLAMAVSMFSSLPRKAMDMGGSGQVSWQWGRVEFYFPLPDSEAGAISESESHACMLFD